MNKFVTPTAVARDASVILGNLLTVGNLVSRDKEQIFTGGKVGDTIKVSVSPVFGDANEFVSTTTATNVIQGEVELKLDKHFYVRVDLTTKQKSLELPDFTADVVAPAMRSISQSIDKYFTSKMQVFRANLTGNVANRPSTLLHLAAANQTLNDALISNSGRVALVDTTVEASLLQLSEFKSVDFGADKPAGLRDAILRRAFGFDFYRDALLGEFDRGDVIGTVQADGGAAKGATTVALKSFTNADGVIKAGTVFTAAGTATRYVVVKDAVKATNKATVEVYPALTAAINNEDAITFEAAGYSNLVYHPSAVAGAIVAPEALWGGNSAVQSINGISVRVSMDGSINSLSDSVVFDVMTGCRVIQPNGGALFCG